MNIPNFLPYGRQIIDDEDIEAVISTLKSDWLTTGPAIDLFEEGICRYSGARHAVAVSNGTAALHAAMFALKIGPGDEVIVPSMTFAATANSVLYQKGTPVFADVEPETLLLAPASVEAAITPRTKAIIGVDYAGQPCDWNALRDIAGRHGIALVADACHALGAELDSVRVGTLADITVFSFHPVKHITTGEGGMAVTNEAALATRMRAFRGHGITTTASQRESAGAWFYEMTELGYNYRITDFQCALGNSQLGKLDQWLAKRNELANVYTLALSDSVVRPLQCKANIFHAYHLYVVRVPNRDAVFKSMRSAGIGCNVHYIPVHLHPYYKEHLGTREGMCPVAEAAYSQVLSLPLWPGMDSIATQRVITHLLSEAFE